MVAKGRLSRRFRRIITLLPYAIKHPGITVDELADRFGASSKEIIEDLRLAWLCGLPGYGPGDLIEVSLEGDRVFVSMADYFGAPLRLTPAEAVALYSGGAAMLELPGMDHADSLASALHKLAAALGARSSNGASGVKVKLETGPAAHVRALTEALEARRRVRLEYYSATSAEISHRVVEPWGLVAALGRVYLVGLDHQSQDERMFRTDRIKSVEVLEESAAVPEGFDRERYRGAFTGRGELTLYMEVSPTASAWFEDYYPTKNSRALQDGWRAVELVTTGTRWPATLVIRLGKEARAVRPPEVLAEAHALAARIAARYRRRPS